MADSIFTCDRTPLHQAPILNRAQADAAEAAWNATSTDPEAHSIHLTDTHLPMTIEPMNFGTSCGICSESYKDGAWQLLVPEARDQSGQQLTMCLRCVKDISAAVAQFPAEPAPWVEY